MARGGRAAPWAPGRPLRRAGLLALVAALLAACGAAGGQASDTTGVAAGRTTGTRAARHVIPLANFALPPTTTGCGGAVPLGGGAERVPVTVSTVGTQVAVLTNLCISGKGPYPFVIDTGATQSEIDEGLAMRLGLRTQGSLEKFEGVGCTGTSQPRRATTWSWAGVPLLPQVLSAATIPGMGGAGQPVGLLGSDVLSRFGAVRIDFSGSAVVLPGPEGPAPSGLGSVQGPTAVPTPKVLLAGTAGGTVPVTVDRGPEVSEVIAPISIGGHRSLPFAVDTGSSQSVVAQSLAASSGLRHTDTSERQTTVCSTITVPIYNSGPWKVGTVPLVRGPIATANLGPVGSAGFVGLLGSDQLIHFGWVVFDYAGARLVLGTR